MCGQTVAEAFVAEMAATCPAPRARSAWGSPRYLRSAREGGQGIPFLALLPQLRVELLDELLATSLEVSPPLFRLLSLAGSAHRGSFVPDRSRYELRDYRGDSQLAVEVWMNPVVVANVQRERTRKDHVWIGRA